MRSKEYKVDDSASYNGAKALIQGLMLRLISGRCGHALLPVLMLLILVSGTTWAQSGVPSIKGFVVGGGRVANVEGNTRIDIYAADTIAAVFGANDIAGSVATNNTATGSTIVIGEAGGTQSIAIGSVYGAGSGYYRYNTYNIDSESNTTGFSSATTSVTVTGDVYAWNGSDAVTTLTQTRCIPTIPTTSITINGDSTVIDSVFSGAKNAFVTKASDICATLTINGGTIYAVFGGNNVGGSIGGATADTATAYATSQIVCNGSTQGSTYEGIGVNHGIRYLFGGGNKILGCAADITFNGGMIDTLFAGGNQASVLATTVRFNGPTKPTDYCTQLTGSTPATLFDVRCLFGGNNETSMAVLPRLYLNRGYIHMLYGGGNAGAMTAAVDSAVRGLAAGVHKSTFISMDSSDIYVDELYGGCQKADVACCTYVSVTDGHVGTLYGGCNISGNVTDTTYVLLNGGEVCRNLFGGSNGDYACSTVNSEGLLVYTAPYVDTFAAAHYAGLTIPIVNNTYINIDGSSIIDGNVYGGGNRAPVGTAGLSGITSPVVGGINMVLNHGTIRGDVYGGGRMASVNGHADVIVTDSSTIHIGRLFGGNDIAGDVSGEGRNDTSLDGTLLTQANAASYVKVMGHPTIGELFGGGNGESTAQYAAITNDDGEAIYQCSTTPAPVQTSTYIDVEMECATADLPMGTIGTTYGGGNYATVGQATSYIAGGGYIETVFGGGNSADVTADAVFVTINSDAAACPRTAAGAADSLRYNVKTIFGGNNYADMHQAIPEINLLKGRFGSVYGGGNAGDMLANKSISVDTAVGVTLTVDSLSTFIHLNSADVEVADYMYGGCNQANVAQGTWVLIEAGSVNTLFGGNDIAGLIGGNTRIDLLDGTVNKLYGGSNGMYDYDIANNGAVYPFGSTHMADNRIATASSGRPVVDTAIVNIVGGALLNNLYGGGLAANTGTTIVTIDGDAIVHGQLFAGGCGDTAHVGYCQGEHPHLGNVTQSTNMTVRRLSPLSTMTHVYGGGRAGDVNDINLSVVDCNYHIRTLYGGCYASNVLGTANVQLSQSAVDTTYYSLDGENILTASNYIDTVYGGNNFAGWVYNTALTIDGGNYQTLFGAGNGEYDYHSMLPNGITCYDTLPYSQYITLNLTPDTVRYNVYGGGNMGVVGKDFNLDNAVTSGSLTTIPSYYSLIEAVSVHPSDSLSTHFPYGEYGAVVVNVYDGYYGNHIFGGARGNTAVSVYNHKHLFYGFKEVNLYDGEIERSLYGGSEIVDDGYPWECIDSLNTTCRPSTVLNLMGGHIHKSCYGGGYRGNIYGSVYVNVGVDAVRDNYMWQKTYNGQSYASFKPTMTAAPLYFDGSIYNGADWGTAGSQVVFNTRGFYGGESLIYIDGKGYHTSMAEVSDLPAMNIQHSIIGSGTSTEGGDCNRRIFMRNYGDFNCPAPSKELYSIQRADRVVIDSCYFTLTGEADASIAYATSNRTFGNIDTLTFRGDNVISISKPAVNIGVLYSEEWTDTYAPYTASQSRVYAVDDENHLRASATLNTMQSAGSCDDLLQGSTLCDNYAYYAYKPSNTLLMSDGCYVSVNANSLTSDKYGHIRGYMYLTSLDGSRCQVYAVDKNETTSTNSTDGGFMALCNGNTTQTESGTSAELPFDNYPAYKLRSWEVGTDEGSRNRHIVIVASSAPDTINGIQDNHWIDSVNSDFAYAHQSLQLPLSATGNYYKLTNILVDQDNGGQVQLIDAAYHPAISQDGSAGWLTTSDLNDTVAITRNPNYSFGLMMSLDTGDFAISPGCVDSLLLLGNTSYSQFINFRSCPVQQQNSITEMHFYLTYDAKHLSSTIIRDVILEMEEYDSNGNSLGKIQVTVTIATIIPDFRDIEIEMLAMYNEGVTNEFVRKIVLPSTFRYRQLYLTGVEWDYHVAGYDGEDNEMLYGMSSDKCLWNVQSSDAVFTVNNQFGFKLRCKEVVTDNISNTLGWYDIQNQAMDVYDACLNEAGTDLNGSVKREYTDTCTGTNCVNTNVTTDEKQKAFTAIDSLHIPFGALDGRATAAIEADLYFNGNLVYPNNAYVGKVALTFSYYDENDDGTTTEKNFKVKLRVKTREKGDTIYIASALSGNYGNRSDTTVNDGLYIERNGRKLHACTAPLKAVHGYHPDDFVVSFSEAASIYEEGDVFCVLDTVDIYDNNNINLLGDDYSIIQVIRYAGNHKDAPGKDFAYRGPLVRVREGSYFGMRNVWFNGSGLTQTLRISGDDMIPEPDTLIAAAPMIVVTENGSLSLGGNVKMTNNFTNNSNTITPGDRNIMGYTDGLFPGGAIGIYRVAEDTSYTRKIRNNEDTTIAVAKSKTGYPLVTLGNNTRISDNLVILTDGSNNQGAGLYMNGGKVLLGQTIGGGDDIQINRNYIVDAASINNTDCGGWFKQKQLTKTTFTYNSNNCNETSNESTYTCYVLDTTRAKVNIFAHRVDDRLDSIALPSCANNSTGVSYPASLSNMYLTRMPENDSANVDMNDRQSDYLSFNSVLAPSSLIGITKWFPGPTQRDTMQIAKVIISNPLTVEQMYNNDVFFDDSSSAYIFYHSTVNNYTIYFQRCATFRSVVRQISEVTNDSIALSYHINLASHCSAVQDSLRYCLQGGFYPYTYTWKQAAYQGKTDYYVSDWTEVTAFDTVRRRITVGTNLAVEKDPMLRAAAGVDTCVLTSMVVDSVTKDFLYVVEGTDLTDNCAVEQPVEIRVRRMEGETYGTLVSGDDKWLVSYADKPSTSMANPGVDSSYFHRTASGITFSERDTIPRYFRLIQGVTITPSVHPDDYAATITAIDPNDNRFVYRKGNNDVNDYSGVLFCPGDVLTLTTARPDTSKSFLMWDFDPQADTVTAYTVPMNNSSIQAIYVPKTHWYQVVTMNDNSVGYEEDYNGNVTITNERGLAWLISTSNGLNGERANRFHGQTVTIRPKADGASYDMGAYLWTPVGNINNPFCGTFNGNGDSVVIENITVNEDNLPYVGFFGNLDSATVQNTKLQHEYLRGNNYVGGLVAMAYTYNVINNNQVSGSAMFSGSYCVGGLIGCLRDGYSVMGNTVGSSDGDVTILGQAVYAGGLVGYQLSTADAVVTDISNNNVSHIDLTKIGSALYLGGLAGSSTENTTAGKRGRLWRAKPAVQRSNFRNNYVHIVTNDNGFYAGGMAGYLTNANLENNYVYGRVRSTNRAGSLVAMTGSNISIDHCYYMDGTSTYAFGNTNSAKQSMQTSAFSGSGNRVTTHQRVDGIDNLTRLLNRWVTERNSDEDTPYFTWTSDLVGLNNGYPYFGNPDMIPVTDSLLVQACDEYMWNDTPVLHDTVIVLNYVDSVDHIDSTMSIIIALGTSSTELFFDSVRQGESYLGHGFNLTADELEQLRGTVNDGVKTVQIIDSLLSLHGCDSVVILNLTLLMSGDVDIDPAVDLAVSVYPNPTTDVVTVEGHGLLSIAVYDNLSRQILSTAAQSDRLTFNLSRYSTGTYYLKVTTRQGVVIKKIIKK